MKTNRIIIVCTIFLLNLFYSQSAKSQNKEGGIVEINLPDSIKGYIKFWESYPEPKYLDSIPINNGKCIFKYRYLEMPTIAKLIVFQNAKKKRVDDIYIENKYDHPTTVYGNIVLDNSHAVMHATPWVANYLSCTYENVKGSGNGCLEITLPDSIHGLVHFRKWDGSQFIPLDSARIVNRKCTFYYNTSEITDERVSFYVEQPYSTIIPENIQTGSTWNYLLKNNTLIKANANPKTIFNNFIATLSGSPETYVQMQLMSKTSGYKDLQGYISKAFIQKHSDSKLLLRELFYSGSSYASVNDLKEAFSLFNENTRQSSKGKELASYIKEREEYDKHGVSRKFVYFDATGKQYNLNDCMNGKQLCVVVFWASWCGPCLEEIPRLKEFYKEYKDQVSLVNLSIDNDYTKWTDRMKQYPVEWLNLSGLPKEKKKVANDFGVGPIPCFMVIDSKGKIIASQYIRKGNEMRPLELENIKEIINQKIHR